MAGPKTVKLRVEIRDIDPTDWRQVAVPEELFIEGRGMFLEKVTPGVTL